MMTFYTWIHGTVYMVPKLLLRVYGGKLFQILTQIHYWICPKCIHNATLQGAALHSHSCCPVDRVALWVHSLELLIRLRIAGVSPQQQFERSPPSLRFLSWVRRNQELTAVEKSRRGSFRRLLMLHTWRYYISNLQPPCFPIASLP